MPKISDPLLIDEAMRLFKLGYATADIGYDLNVSVNTIAIWAKQRGVQRPAFYHPQKPIPYRDQAENADLTLISDCKRLLKLLEQERGQRLKSEQAPRATRAGFKLNQSGI